MTEKSFTGTYKNQSISYQYQNELMQFSFVFVFQESSRRSEHKLKSCQVCNCFDFFHIQGLVKPQDLEPTVTYRGKGQLSKFFKCKIAIIFLPINLNMCFGYSKEPSH